MQFANRGEGTQRDQLLHERGGRGKTTKNRNQIMRGRKSVHVYRPSRSHQVSHPSSSTKSSEYHLTEDDKMHILQVFDEDVVPRLMRMDARIGNLNCEFAGKKYGNWVVEFKSNQSGFEIVGFEYDEDSRIIPLSARPLIQQIDDNV
jgi:hypothetical protein